MSDKENNIIYTAKDIEQYLEGNLTPRQMHAMEKAALDDPFLAEAMEGYEAAKKQDWNKQLAVIREELNSKGTSAKVIPLHKRKNNWWKAAAAALLIGTAATITYTFTRTDRNDDPRQQIAQNIPVKKDSLLKIEVPEASVTQSLNPTASASEQDKKAISGTTAKVDNNYKTNTDIIPEPGAPVLNPAAPALSETKTTDEKAVVSVPPSPANPAVISNADVAGEARSDKSKAASKQAAGAESLPEPSKSQANTIAKKEAVLNNFFSAQVVGADNSPLPFTNISIRKENFETYADARGILRLVSTDSVLHVELRSVGFQPKTFVLRNNQPQTKLVLQEEELSDKDRKVIAGAAPATTLKPRRAMLLKDSAVNVEPADGWENYNTYVANNLDIPESALKGDRHGEVELTFDVKANGTISNIRINKSLGAEYDEAAKRMLQEGPQWKVKRGKKTSASIKLQF